MSSDLFFCVTTHGDLSPEIGLTLPCVLFLQLVPAAKTSIDEKPNPKKSTDQKPNPSVLATMKLTLQGRFKCWKETQGRGDSGFQVRRRCKGVFGFETHDFGIFWGKKILASIFSGSFKE